MKRYPWSSVIACTIVVAATTLAIFSSLGDAPIVDEVPHIGAGYSYVMRQDFRLNPEHPPLVKDIAGLGIAGLNLSQQAFSSADWTTDTNGQWNFGRQIIFHSGVSGDTVKNWARTPILIFFLLSCWLVWRWSRERSGTSGALLALTLFAFSPTILAHARFVTTDMAAAAGVLAATYFFLTYLRAPTRRNFWVAGVVLGLALLCKFSTALLGPYFILIALLWGLDGTWQSKTHWRKALELLWQTVLIGLVSLAVVWGVYLIQTWNYPVAHQIADTRQLVPDPGHNPIGFFALWASDKPVIRALGHWALGLGLVEQRSAGGNTIYWMGQVVRYGGVWYFPTVYFLKEPIAWWLLVAMAMASVTVAAHRHRGKDHEGWWQSNADQWVWGLWLVIYWAVSLHSNLNIGVRHLLPVYPFTIMLVAGCISTALTWLHEHNHARRGVYLGVVTVLVGWYVFESVHVYPFYLTYFNQFAGGPSGGYRYVVDSNLDWGQDLKRLGTFVTDNHIQHLTLDYFGWSDPVSYIGNAYLWTTANQWKDKKDFLARNQSNGWIGVSATFYQNANGIRTRADQDPATYRWLLDTPPAAIIGNSIFIWHIVK